MKIVKMETHMLSQKVIANVTPEFARVYNIPEGHTSVGFFSADNDDMVIWQWMMPAKRQISS